MESEIGTRAASHVLEEQIILSNKYYYENPNLKKLFSEEEKPFCPITGNKIPKLYRNTSYCPRSARDCYLCPLTKQLYYNPVLCSDGFFYEKKAIKQRFADEEYTSPNTGEPISQEFSVSAHFNYMLHLFYRDHPEELCNRYDPHETHLDNKVIVSQIIKKRKFNKLVKYKKFDLRELFKNKLLVRLLKNADDDIMEYVIDNIIDLEISNEHHKNWHLIHYVTRYCGPRIIKLLISKGVNMEAQTTFGWKPIHFMCRYNSVDNDESIDLIKYVINMGIDLECETNDKWRPVHFVCAYGNRDLIEYLLTKNVRFDTKITRKKTEEISCGKGKMIRTKKLCNDDAAKLLLGNKNLSEDDKIELICKCKNKAADQSICKQENNVPENNLVPDYTENTNDSLDPEPKSMDGVQDQIPQSSIVVPDNLQLSKLTNSFFGQIGTEKNESRNEILSETVLVSTKQDNQENLHDFIQPEPLENHTLNSVNLSSETQFSEVLFQNFYAEKISSESDSDFTSGKTYAHETSDTSDDEISNNITKEKDLELVF